MVTFKPNCRRFEVQDVSRAFSFDLARAGSKRLARIAIIATTTSNSISVNAWNLRALTFPIETANCGVDARCMTSVIQVCMDAEILQLVKSVLFTTDFFRDN